MMPPTINVKHPDSSSCPTERMELCCLGMKYTCMSAVSPTVHHEDRRVVSSDIDDRAIPEPHRAADSLV